MSLRRLIGILVALSIAAPAHAASTSANLTITVTGSGPIATSLTASPTSIAPGASTTINWSATNATTCAGYGGFSTGGATSGSLSVSPITTTSYGLFCRGAAAAKSAIATVTVSQTNVVAANGNCLGAHAGTSGDPFPFQCIVNAINGLPAGGGTVTVGSGVWNTGTTGYSITRGNWNLIGNGVDSRITFPCGTDPSLHSVAVGFADGSAMTPSVRISNLILDMGTRAACADGLRLSGLQNSSLSYNTIISTPNGSVEAILVEGGQDNNTIQNNILPPASPAGGSSGVQFNPLGNTPNTGLLVYNNLYDSSELLIIGLLGGLFTGNTVNNPTAAYSISILVSPSLGSGVGAEGIIIDNNLVDASNGPQNSTIAEIPQDPGPIGTVNNMVFSNNTVKGSHALVALTNWDFSCLPDTNPGCAPLPLTVNPKIINNTLTSLSSGSVISIQGGPPDKNGGVQNPLVEGNVLNGTTTNQIIQDVGTSNPTLINNTFNP